VTQKQKYFNLGGARLLKGQERGPKGETFTINGDVLQQKVKTVEK